MLCVCVKIEKEANGKALFFSTTVLMSLIEWLRFNCRRLLGDRVNGPCVFILSSIYVGVWACVCLFLCVCVCLSVSIRGPVEECDEISYKQHKSDLIVP